MTKATRLKKLNWLLTRSGHVHYNEKLEDEDPPHDEYIVDWPSPYEDDRAYIRATDGEIMSFYRDFGMVHNFEKTRELGNSPSTKEASMLQKIDRRIKWLVESIGASQAVAEARATKLGRNKEQC